MLSPPTADHIRHCLFALVAHGQAVRQGWVRDGPGMGQLPVPYVVRDTLSSTEPA